MYLYGNMLQLGVVRLCKTLMFFRHPFRGPRFISWLPRSIEIPVNPSPSPSSPSLPLLDKAHLSREISPDILPAHEMSPMRFDISSCVWMGCSLLLSLSPSPFYFSSLFLSLPSLIAVWFMGSPDICLSIPTWGRVDDPRRRTWMCTIVYKYVRVCENLVSLFTIFSTLIPLRAIQW